MDSWTIFPRKSAVKIRALAPLWLNISVPRCPLWLKYELFYAKQTQFPKQQNERNISPNNQLPITIYQLPICKTNPNKPNFKAPIMETYPSVILMMKKESAKTSDN